MSYELFGDDVLFFQRLLKSDGFYTGILSGYWGPLTEAASEVFYARHEAIKLEIGAFDRRRGLYVIRVISRHIFGQR